MESLPEKPIRYFKISNSSSKTDRKSTKTVPSDVKKIYAIGSGNIDERGPL
jgi:hypothetical protein